jgi:predicted nuclease of predicted toxin-antitoxin system
VISIVIDMNLSPDWVERLSSAGYDAVHWSTVGDPRATDREIMRWAAEHQRAVMTHDLDFGAVLAATQARVPSVIQLRAADVLLGAIAERVVRALADLGAELQAGAIVSIEIDRARVRILPLPSSGN